MKYPSKRFLVGEFRFFAISSCLPFASFPMASANGSEAVPHQRCRTAQPYPPFTYMWRVPNADTRQRGPIDLLYLQLDSSFKIENFNHSIVLYSSMGGAFPTSPLGMLWTVRMCVWYLFCWMYDTYILGKLWLTTVSQSSYSTVL